MTISAKIVLDSISPNGIRLTTMQLRYPKFIHGEAKTHRVMRIGDKAYESLEEVGFMDDPNLSRNASSSRAIPVERLIQDVVTDPVVPMSFGRNRPGMQATEELTDAELDRAREMWLAARNAAVEHARDMAGFGIHKQIVNRIIEPFCHINVVVTATEWANFFALRMHKDAQPEMRVLAEMMWAARRASTPTLLKNGQWHLPYVDAQIEDDDCQSYRYHLGDYGIQYIELDAAIKISVARCARVSYLTHEGRVPDLEEDLALYDRLVSAVPLHASPAEHQATPDRRTRRGFIHACYVDWNNPRLHGNLVGWIQYRKTLPNENVADR